MKFSRLPLIVVLMFLVLVGCAEKKEPVVELPPGPTITDSVLGIHIPELPLVWELIEDRPQGRLAVTDRVPRIGKVEAFLLEEDFGMNIFETIKAHQREIEGQPDGHYYGAQELVGVAFGTAFYSRGRYSGDDGSTWEETSIFMLNHEGLKILAFRYRYPAGNDSEERVQALLELLETVEPIPYSAE